MSNVHCLRKQTVNKSTTVLQNLKRNTRSSILNIKWMFSRFSAVHGIVSWQASQNAGRTPVICTSMLQQTAIHSSVTVKHWQLSTSTSVNNDARYLPQRSHVWQREWKRIPLWFCWPICEKGKKAKLSMCTVKHHTIQTCGLLAVVQYHAHGRFTHGEGNSGTQWVGGCAEPRKPSGQCGKQKSFSSGEWKSDTSTIQ